MPNEKDHLGAQKSKLKPGEHGGHGEGVDEDIFFDQAILFLPGEAKARGIFTVWLSNKPDEKTVS